MSNGRNDLTRFLGGSPTLVLLRLVLLSVVVGVILAALGLDPGNIFQSLERFAGGLLHLGVDALSHVWRYFLLGAAVVLPLWLLLRITGGFR